MKLARLGPRGQEQPVVVTEDGTYDLSRVVFDLTGQFLDADGLEGVRAAIAAGTLPRVETDGVRWGAPIARPSAVICIGMNYAAHAAESGAAPPKQPVVFLKTPNTVGGPDDPVQIPRGREATDWEVELGVVIGRPARDVPEARALEHVAGYTVLDDVSAREFQFDISPPQTSFAKGMDGFCPMGPWIATPEEVGEPWALGVRCWLNGELVQEGNTRDLIFSVAALISYLSRYLVLQPGDVIATGTPAGVGIGFDPPRFLAAGDVVEVSITGLGTQRNRIG